MAKTVKYDHAVVYNGVFYSANVPIPVEDKKPKTAAPDEGENVANGKAETATPDAEAEDKEAAPDEGENAEEKAVKANANKGKGRKPKADSKSAK